jgi:hypothetical protein
VILAACQNTMRAMKMKTEDLFPFSTEVDSGVSELVRKHLKNPMHRRADAERILPVPIRSLDEVERL